MHLRDTRERLTCAVPACERKMLRILTYLEHTKIQQNSRSFSISLPLLQELVYKRLCGARADRSYQYLFHDSFCRESFFPIKYSLRIAYVFCLGLASLRKFFKALRNHATSRTPAIRSSPGRSYNGCLAPRGNLFAYATFWINLNLDNPSTK